MATANSKPAIPIVLTIFHCLDKYLFVTKNRLYTKGIFTITNTSCISMAKKNNAGPALPSMTNEPES